MSTSALLLFRETVTEVLPVDGIGNLIDLRGDPNSVPVLSLPAKVRAFSGPGREFGDGLGLVGVEDVAGSLRLTRDCTVRAIMSYATDAAADGEIGTLAARGLGGSDAERILFGVEFVRVSATILRVRARWEEQDGSSPTIYGYQFAVGSGEFFSIGVSRTWIDTNTVEVTYVANDQLLGVESVTAGDIAQGAGGTLTIGCAGDGAGAYERFLPDGSIIDSMSIESDAMSFEELRQEYRRIAVHQPSGYQILRAYQPPGDSWSKDPESNVQQWIAAEGDTLGNAIALVEAIREDTLPDRAYGPNQEHWEKLLKIQPSPGQTLEARRKTTVGGIRKTVGHSLPEIRTALSPILGLTEDEIEIIEFSGLREDDFSMDDVDEVEPSMLWRTHFGSGSVSVAFGSCTIAIPDAADARWMSLGGTPSFREASLAAMQGGTTERTTIVATVDAEIGEQDLLALSGLMMRDVRGNAVFFGFMFDGVVVSLGTMTVMNGIAGPRTSIAASSSATIYMRYVGAGVYEVGKFSGGSLEVLSTAVVGPGDPKWAGFGVFSEGVLSSGDGQDSRFTDLRIHEPNNPRGYTWLAYRDPALPGSYDIEQAQRQIDKQGPAHGIGVAVTQKKGFLLGGDGRLGIDPLFPRTP